MNARPPMIDVRNVVKRYGRTIALDRVSFSVEHGERFAILGPNGAGKTTLMHLLTTIHRADEGTASINGVDVHRYPLRARQRIGVVFQEPSLDTRLTVAENLDFHGRIFGVPRRLRRKRIEDLLSVVELSNWRDHLVRSLSRGMQRRLEIARALIHDAELIVLDEPTIGLDAQTRARMWTYLDALRDQRNLTLLVTTHYIDEVEGVDRVCIIDGGRILAIGTPSMLKREHGSTVVRVEPSDDETRAALREHFPDAICDSHTVVIPAVDDATVGNLLQAYGHRLRALQVVQPSLESVFLTLTGRAIRDEVAGDRDRLLAYGQRGGENTR